MADKKKMDQSHVDALYQWISYDLQRMKDELMKELKLSSAQVGHLYKDVLGGTGGASVALEREIRYSYKQNQNIYEGLAHTLTSMDQKMTALQQLDSLMNDVSELKYSYMQLQSVCEGVSETVNGEVMSRLEAIPDEEQLKSNIEVHSQRILDALAALPVAENVDYVRIGEEVGDKLLEILGDLKACNEEEDAIDYERIAGDTAAKVIESIPFPDQFDYRHIDESVSNAVAEQVNVESIAAAVAEQVAKTVNVESIAQAVAATLNVDAIAEAVAAKIVVPTVEIPEIEVPAAPEVDYNYLADLVVAKITEKGMSADVVLDEEGIAKIADTVAEKVAPCTESIMCTEAPEQVEFDYDRVASMVELDYDRVSAIVEDAIAKSCDEIERVVALDDEGVAKIVDGVAEELRNMTLVCEYLPEEEPVEESAEAIEAPVEETVEEVVEETVEEVVETVEEPVEEVVEEPAEKADEELAVSVAPVYEEDVDGQLIDAETGLVVRLKRSFTAKMKQSEEQVKVYYSDIKNALTSYKRINSNVSWHGDRFNYGRETVAKIGINGKTLCFYLALDPNDPELKTTVYHQKDVGAQKAYENTPFMVKVKSDAAEKKALRLVGILAAKLGAEEDESFQEVDYVAEFAYESTKRLFEEGDIKATKEKKVDFNF